MKALFVLLVLMLAVLQYKLWFDTGNVRDVWRLQTSIEQQSKRNLALRQRNNNFEAEILDLKRGTEAVEERARNQLGMVKPGETYYRIVESDKK